MADDPTRRRTVAVGGYASTVVLSALLGVTGSVCQVGALRGTAWAARGIRVPARNALLADIVPAAAYGRAYGFERMMDNLGAIGGPVLALLLVSAVGVRAAILISVIPGLLAAVAIVYAIHQIARPVARERQPFRIKVWSEVRATATEWTTTGRLSVWAHGQCALREPHGRLRAWLDQALRDGVTRLAALGPTAPSAPPGTIPIRTEPARVASRAACRWPTYWLILLAIDTA